MNINKLIIDAVSPIVPTVVPGFYTGNEAQYVSFNVSDDRGYAYSNDVPRLDLISVQVHFFCPRNFNYLAKKKQIRNALFEAGFTYPTITIMTEDDYTHIVFECEIALEREEEE